VQILRGSVGAIVGLVAALGAPGCGSNGPSPQQFAGDFANDYCALIFQCCTSTEILPIDGNATDLAACQSDMQGNLDQTAMLTAQGHSGYAYDAKAAQDCLDAAGKATCADLSNGSLASACAGTYLGQSAAGQICFNDSWCQAGLICVFEGDSDAGACHAPLALGAACSSWSCGGGLVCDLTQFVCIQPKDLGAACAGNTECASGYCPPDPTGGTDQTCATPPAMCTGG
jgi:hypothetical protein